MVILRGWIVAFGTAIIILLIIIISRQFLRHRNTVTDSRAPYIQMIEIRCMHAAVTGLVLTLL